MLKSVLLENNIKSYQSLVLNHLVKVPSSMQFLIHNSIH